MTAGFELERRPAPPAGETYRLETLLVIAEYSAGDPAWDRPRGGDGPVPLSALDVSDLLVQHLRTWNETYERSALTDDAWVCPVTYPCGSKQSQTLARELQQKLANVEARYFHADDDRPLRNL